MGEDCGTWVPELHFDWQSPNLRSFDAAPFDVGKQNVNSAAINPGANVVTRHAAMPAHVSSALPHSQLGHSGEPHGWFYCLPRFRQGFTMPAPNVNAEEKLPADHVKGFREGIAPTGESGIPQKQFLVIDQTGDQTTMVYSSRFGGLASWDAKLHGSNNLNNGNGLISLKRDVNHVVGLGPTLNDKVDENQGTDDDIESEMHEDTEEINALLYSDSDGYSTEYDDDDDDDDDEVTSTGHSPSSMTTHDNQEEPGEGTAEEVASSVGETKKRKLWDGAYDDDMQFMDTASSIIGKRPCEAGDDAESRCSSGVNCSRGFSEAGSFNKKMRKEKIQDVLTLLQCIVPGAKYKDPIELLDEAIRCLKSLKLKAKELGLDAI